MLILLLLVTCAVILFLLCFFGKLAHENFLNMSDCLFECNWLVYPINIKKYILFMIMNTQRPIYYHGFGIAVLDLITFLKVS